MSVAGRIRTAFMFGAFVTVGLAAAICSAHALAEARALPQAPADAKQRAAAARLGALKLAQAEREAAPDAAAQARYQACADAAQAAHDAAWVAQCKATAEKFAADRANCLDTLKLPKTYCDASYPSRESAPNCTLPGAIASVLDGDLAQARDRCLRDTKAARP